MGFTIDTWARYYAKLTGESKEKVSNELRFHSFMLDNDTVVADVFPTAVFANKVLDFRYRRFRSQYVLFVVCAMHGNLGA